MFGKLYKKIYIPLMVISAVLIIFIDACAIAVQVSAMSDVYRVTGSQKLERIMTSFRLYVNSAEATTRNLAFNENVIEVLSSEKVDSLVATFDSACNYAHKLDAVCAYSTTGAIYTSSNTPRDRVLSIEQLSQDEGIAAFLESESETYVSMRTRYINGIYNNTPYPEEMGVITCCRKVYKNNEITKKRELIGWIFTDILPENIYDYFYKDGQFEDAVAFIITQEGYFRCDKNNGNENMLESKNKGYFEYSSASDDGTYSVKVFESKRDFNAKIWVLAAALAVCSAVLMVAVHFIAHFTAKSVTSRLDRFLDKMNG